MPSAKIGVPTAASLVISAMIGTGVFTSLGYQIVDIKSGFSIMLLWVLGGVVAFFGASAYAELGAVFRRSGGEYQLLGKLYHPALGFVAGWVSVTVGFAAPAAIAAIALSSYLEVIFPGLPGKHVAAGTVLLLSIIHASSLKFGSSVQKFTTALKLILILVLIIFGFNIELPQNISLLPQQGSWSEIIQPAYAVAFVYVSYAYTGWNSAIYILDEMRNPIKDLSRSLLIGTIGVTVLYLLLNWVFLYTVPISVLEGQIEVGFLAGEAIFGTIGGKIMAMAIAVLLVSTVSAYVFLGPRVSQVMGQDLPGLSWLASTSKNGLPVRAFVLSTALSLIFIYTSTFEQVVLYTSFLLILITTLAVGGVYIVRSKKYEASFRMWGYPIAPGIFLGVSIWSLVFVAIDKPFESLISVGILVIGMAIYLLTKPKGGH